MAQSDNESLTTYQDVVDDFISRCSEHHDKVDDWFGSDPTDLETAVGRAALSQSPTGKGGRLIRESHQRRIPGQVLAEAKQHLTGRVDELAQCETFTELFKLVERTILKIPGIGPLTVYDISERIALFLNLKQPSKVYIHAGVREGVKALKLDGKQKTIALNAFPEPLASLGSFRLESVLCNYRKALSRIAENEVATRPKGAC